MTITLRAGATAAIAALTLAACSGENQAAMDEAVAAAKEEMQAQLDNAKEAAEEARTQLEAAREELSETTDKLQAAMESASAGARAAWADMEPVPVEATSGEYVMDKTHASLTWQIGHLGLSDYTARFTTFDAALVLDVDNPENSSITATIPLSAIETDHAVQKGGESDFNSKIAEQFLGGVDATFASTAIERTGPNTAKVTGDLTIGTVTKPITLDARLVGALAEHPFAKQPAVGFQAIGVVNRDEWGVQAPGSVGPDVTVEINAEFIKKADS